MGFPSLERCCSAGDAGRTARDRYSVQGRQPPRLDHAPNPSPDRPAPTTPPHSAPPRPRPSPRPSRAERESALGVSVLAPSGLAGPAAARTRVQRREPWGGMEGLVAAAGGDVSLHNFSARLWEQLVHFHVMRLTDSLFLWVGATPHLRNLAVAMCSRYVSAGRPRVRAAGRGRGAGPARAAAPQASLGSTGRPTPPKPSRGVS